MGMKTCECQAGLCMCVLLTYTAAYTAAVTVCLQDKPSERSGRAWSANAKSEAKRESYQIILDYNS